jgi:hypothetical protein
MKYDYYDVTVPGDCSDSMEDLANIALTEARDRARIYALPAVWTVWRISGEVGDFAVHFRVRRIRNK